MDKKHIVIVQNTTLAENYGLSSYLRNIVNRLAGVEHLKISVICLQGELNKVNCPQNVDLYEMPGSTYSLKSNAIFFWKTFRLLKTINAKQKIDIIHCLYPNSSVAGAVLYKLVYRDVVVLYDLRSPWIHISIERGSISQSVASVYKLFAYASEFLLSLYVDRYIFITQGLYEFYRNKIVVGNKPFVIIPSGIDTAFFRIKPEIDIRKQLNMQRTEKVIGYVGGIAKLRRLDEFLRAFAELPNKAEGYRFIIVGDGDDKSDLESLAKKLKIDDKMIFVGQASQQQVRDYMNAFDVGICHLPDTFVFRRSSPMKIFEYLSVGLPVLASNILANAEMAKVFPQVTLYTNDNLTEKLLNFKPSEKRYSSNLDQYDWKRITEKIVSQYLAR